MDKDRSSPCAVKTARRLLSACLPLTIMMVGGLVRGAEAQQYYVPRPDLRVALNADIVKNFIQSYSNVSYTGTYHNNGKVCTSIRTEVALNYSQLKIGSSTRWLDGARFTQLNYQFGPTAHISCPSVTLGLQCDVSCCPTSGSSSISVTGTCTFAGLITAHFPFVVRLDNAVNYNKLMTIVLPNTQGAGADQTSFEFGQFVGGNWQIAANPQSKAIEALFDFSAFGGQAAANACSSSPPANPLLPQSAYSDGRLFIFDMSMGGDRRFSKVADAASAAATFVDMEPVAKNQLGFISVSPALFGYTKLSGGSEGLFGQVLPIRVFGTRTIKGVGAIQWEVFLTKADAKFVGAKSNPKIRVLFGTELARVWGNPVVGNAVLKSVDVELLIKPPRPDVQGNLKLDLEKFTFTLDFEAGSIKIPIDVSKIEAALSQGLPTLGQIPAAVQISLPQCLDVGVSKLESDNRCNDFGGQTSGFLSANGPWQHQLKFDFSKMIPTLTHGYLSFPLTGAAL